MNRRPDRYPVKLPVGPKDCMSQQPKTSCAYPCTHVLQACASPSPERSHPLEKGTPCGRSCRCPAEMLREAHTATACSAVAPPPCCQLCAEVQSIQASHHILLLAHDWMIRRPPHPKQMSRLRRQTVAMARFTLEYACPRSQVLSGCSGMDSSQERRPMVILPG